MTEQTEPIIDDTQRGVLITRSMMIRRGLSDDADALIDELELSSGMKISKSKLISCLIKLLLEKRASLKGEKIHDETSLMDEFRRALAEKSDDDK